MSTHLNGSDVAGSRAGIASVVDHLRSLARLERELAVTELRRKVGMTAGGIGAGIAALLLSFFVVALGIAVIVAALTLVLDTWLALLVVFLLVTSATTALGVVAVALVRHRGPMRPESALAELRRTGEIVGGGHGD